MKQMWLTGIMGLVVGDALGLPVQFSTREEMKAKPVTDMEGYGAFLVPEGSWSDDSSLAMATLCSLLEKEGVDYEDMMGRFADWQFKGDYTPFGYAYDQGRTCLEAIYSYAKGADVEHCGQTGERSNGNGSLMRILPVCLYAYGQEKTGTITVSEALEIVHKVSALTHAHLRSKMACGIYYFLVKEVLDGRGSLQERLQKGMDEARVYYEKDITNLVELAYYGKLFNMESLRLTIEEQINSSGYVVDSLEAAVWGLLTTDTYKDALLKVVNLGEDTDTIAAIAGGLGALYYGYEDIPAEWIEVVQRREWIEEVCKGMDGKV